MSEELKEEVKPVAKKVILKKSQKADSFKKEDSVYDEKKSNSVSESAYADHPKFAKFKNQGEIK
jgi:hypothetical protein